MGGGNAVLYSNGWLKKGATAVLCILGPNVSTVSTLPTLNSTFTDDVPKEITRSKVKIGNSTVKLQDLQFSEPNMGLI